MRTSFELKIAADDITEAKEIATKKIAAFLNLPEDSVEDTVNLELKVTYPEAKTLIEIAENQDAEPATFVVTVYASVKQSVTKPFGF